MCLNRMNLFKIRYTYKVFNSVLGMVGHVNVLGIKDEYGILKCIPSKGQNNVQDFSWRARLHAVRALLVFKKVEKHMCQYLRKSN